MQSNGLLMGGQLRHFCELPVSEQHLQFRAKYRRGSTKTPRAYLIQETLKGEWFKRDRGLMNGNSFVTFFWLRREGFVRKGT